MGGRGSAVNVVNTYGAKYGSRMTPQQYKEAVNAEANFVFRQLEQSDPVQIIIKRAYRNGVLIAQVASDGDKILTQRGLADTAIQDMSSLVIKLNSEKVAADKEKYTTKTWSGFDSARAKAQVNNQIMKQLDEAIKKLKKR